MTSSHGAKSKPLLVFVNPTSGTKLAKTMLQQILKPELDKRDVEFELVLSQYAGHVTQVVAKCDLNQYSGLVTVSGDGLIYEVFNGLYARKDWNSIACKTPVGIVPGGSGNALNCSLLRQLGQPLDGINGLGAQSSAVNVAEGIDKTKTVSLDLIEAELFNGQKLVSFLGISIGLIADVDIGSEHLRCLGYMRAYLYVAYRIMWPVKYVAKVSYLPLKLDPDGKPIGVTPSDTPLTLPPLTEPVPDDWVTEDGNYYCVYAMNLSLLDPITLFAPEAKLGDGVLWLVKIREGMNRWQMIDWLLNTQTAGHLCQPGVELVPVRAFRIEPIKPEGFMSCDAESVPFGPVQGQILGQKARLLSASS